MCLLSCLQQLLACLLACLLAWYTTRLALHYVDVNWRLNLEMGKSKIRRKFETLFEFDVKSAT